MTNNEEPTMIDEETDLPIDTTEPRFPEVELTVDIFGTEGNAFFLISKVRRELAYHDASEEEVEEFDKEAKSGDYQNVLDTIGRWITFTYFPEPF
jgi:hypothetical protein